ncbi:MAG: PhzF family phenazine biosynthesis protein [Deltaproteobacteria bacterium]|nr:PhzF family phenazine biosynthesis protein [Deltaproteobacteria bacterium]
MKKIPVYQVDAFTSRVFKGNPAAVCPLEQWLEDSLMQAIALENNLSETAFFVPNGDDYDIRWFTPLAEVDLCGHATLASAFVIFKELGPSRSEASFQSRSGQLTVKRHGDLLAMDFPSQPPTGCQTPRALLEGLGKEPLEVLCSEDYLALYRSQDEVLALTPDLEKLKVLDRRGVIVTAQGKEMDFVSRFFAPKLGVPEDPVTGSAHCCLTPYWAAKLGKKRLHARQVSARGGELFCEHRGDRVIIGGHAARFMEGTILLP